MHVTTVGFERVLTRLGVSKETAKNISQKTPSKNGNVSLPSFLESLTVANISGEVYELKNQILAFAISELNVNMDTALHLKQFSDVCVELGITSEEAYLLFDKVDKETVGHVTLRDLSAFMREAIVKYRPHPAVALQKVCFLMVFEKCDPEEVGEISEEAFCRMMSVNGVIQSASLDVFRAIDVDRGGSLSLQEFSRILAINTDSDVNVRIVKSAILKQAFNMMDKNRSQSLTKEELSEGLGPFVSMEDVNKMWAKFDHDGDGIISFPEFTRSLVYWATPVDDPRPAMAIKYACAKVLFNEVLGGQMEASIGHHLSTSAGSRIITEEAFIRYLVALNTNRDDARRVFMSLDKDKSGTVDWNEFSHMFAMSEPDDESFSEGLQYAWTAVRRTLWDRIFKQLDFDPGRPVNYMDFEKAMRPFGASTEDLQNCFRWLDIDQSGDVSITELHNRFCPIKEQR